MASALLTAEDLIRLLEVECRCEIVNGQLVTLPFSDIGHGFVLADVAFAIHQYVRSHHPGVVAIRTGVILHRDPATARAPDLTVEVVSFNDLADAFQQRVMDGLTAGVRLVWVL